MLFTPQLIKYEQQLGIPIFYNIYKDNITLTGTETCKKKKWANHWNIKWDGITNYNSC